MGPTGESGGTAAKPPNPPPTPATAVSPAAAMPYAYYATGAAGSANPAAFFSYYASGQLMPPYTVAPTISYTPVFPNGGGAYAHHSAEAVGTPHPIAEFDGNMAKGGATKEVSGSADDDATQSDESGSEGSSDTRGDGIDLQGFSAASNRTWSGTLVEAQAAIQYTTTTSQSPGVSRVAKLPVSAPGRAALSGPPHNLNIGMEVWRAPHVKALPVKIGPNEMNHAPTLVRSEGVMPERQWMQVEEHELKKQKRKLSNRESARRSRLRKQQECEDLARKVDELIGESSAMKVELEKVKEDCNELRAENATLVERLKLIRPELLERRS